jgi:hypothetical protein
MKKSLDATRAVCAALTLVLLIPALPALGVVQPKGDSPLQQKAFRHPDLYIRQQGKAIGELPPALAAKAAADLSALGGQAGYYDVRSGRWSLLIMSRPLVAESGVTEQAARAAVLGYVTQFQAQLGVVPTEVDEPRVSVFDGGRVVQFHAQRVVNGVPVRDGWIKATLNSGNIVLMGTQNWGAAAVATVPVVSAENAFERVKSYAGTSAMTLQGSKLEVVPFEKGDDPSRVVIGDGATYRLVWAVKAVARGDNGTWEGLVDARTGEILAFQDLNQYTRKVQGGIYPVSNDGQAPDGVEQPGFPMPYAYMLGTNVTTNSSGMAIGVGSEVRTNLSGPYVRMHDECGVANELAMCTDLDLGTSGGDDCVVPAGHSAGDTHASRSGFYELNRQIEGWRNRLPGNYAAQPWMNSQLVSNMNIDDTCNAFWNGSSINFYRSGCSDTAESPPCPTSTNCGNTGEIAAVFDHEWGHGLDNNDTDPSISSPGESIADIYGILRVTDSCFGRGFFIDGTCDNGGSECATCTGVRDLDWDKHVCNKPHDITWINQVGYPVATLCTPVTAQGGCVGYNFIQVGPCGEETHCEGQVPAEAVYDLFARDLQGFGGLTNYGFNTALEITTRLVAAAAGNLASWYTCTQGAGGCDTMSGYMLFLAADDDNGNLANGTPHMQAIFNAFNRHGIACATPAAVNNGCAAISQIPPTLTVTAGANSASLSWSSVHGAARYEVYRTEGVKGCDFGKVKVGETTGTTFVDTGLRDGFEVLYTVLPVGSNSGCVGRMPECQTVTPTAPAADIDIALSEIPNGLAINTGDGDVYLDNCEQATLTFRVENAGTVPLTNVRITGVELVGKPASDIITPLPLTVAATIPPGCPATQPLQPTVAFRPQGLSFDETLVVRVTVAANELASPRTASFSITATESSFEFQSSKIFDFETDLQGWKIVSGTYTRMPPGAPPSPGNALYSSSAKDSQCDNIRSPEVRLTATSQLSLYNQFSTEPETPVGTYDRANVGIFDVATGARTTIVPTGGRPYTYDPGTTGGACVTENQAGWATSPTNPGTPFDVSSWSSAALGPHAGTRKRIDVAYGTDPAAAGAGFQFDEVTLTNFDLQVADTSNDACAPLPPPPPDLQVTSIITNNNKSVREGDKVTIRATVSNTGSGAAPASQTEFRVDNTILGLVATPPLAGGAAAQVSIQWDTRSQKGTHTIKVTADAGTPPTVAESDETNNSSTATVNVQGNKVKNSSFEQAGSSGSGPDGWSGESTGAGNASWSEGGSDGSKSAGASGNGGNAAASGSPSWTSDPIAVTPGEALTFAVSVSSVNASSAANAGLVYLGAAGNVLQTVNLITAPLTTAGFAKLEQAVTIPAGVSQVRVKLVGFSPADLRTSGTVRFDEVGLFGN